MDNQQVNADYPRHGDIDYGFLFNPHVYALTLTILPQYYLLTGEQQRSECHKSMSHAFALWSCLKNLVYYTEYTKNGNCHVHCILRYHNDLENPLSTNDNIKSIFDDDFFGFSKLKKLTSFQSKYEWIDYMSKGGAHGNTFSRL